MVNLEVGVSRAADTLDDVVRDVDLVVFRLERSDTDPERWQAERKEIRRELERLRDRLSDLLETL